MHPVSTTLPLSAALLAACCLTGCGSDDDDDDMMQPEMTTLAMQYTGLTDLGDDYVYEGWLIVDGAPVTSGRFSVDDAGMAMPASFDIPADTAAAATTFVLTIEPAVGDDPAPAATHLLAGDFVDGEAMLDVGHAAALADDFMTSDGTFFLATPSTSGDATDENMGIWFLSGGAASLQLPTLPAGWVYEGWAVAGGTPYSTGTFTDPAMADSDGGGSSAGPDGTPPFPGQDFISMPALDLVGGTAVISIEPSPDNDPAPFLLKPLVGAISDAGAMVDQDLDQNLGSLPTGMVSLSGLPMAADG